MWQSFTVISAESSENEAKQKRKENKTSAVKQQTAARRELPFRAA